MKRNSNILSLAKANYDDKKFYNYSSVTFKTVKVLYWIILAYSAMMCLTILIGNLVLMGEYSAKETTQMVAKFNEQSVQAITVGLSLLSLIACYVFLKLKKGYALAVCGVVYTIVSFTVFYSAGVKNDIQNGGMGSFWGIFGVPSIVCCVFSLGIATIIIYNNIKIIKEYDKIVSKLYDIKTENGAKKISLEEFEVIMNEYNGEELFRTDIPLKKSLKSRKSKQEKEIAENKNEDEE